MSTRYLLFIIAFLGLLVSGYLFVTYLSGGPIRCGDGHGCEVVRGSAYSNFFGIPTPAYGLLFYVALGLGAALWSDGSHKLVYLFLLITTGIGLAISLYLTYLEAYVIHAWCRWCVVSAVLTVLAFLVVWGKLPKYGNHHRN